MIIIGAGLSGLIAGNMLRRFKPQILEAQSSLPNNHAALLRFRSLDVSNACAVPFKKVKVHKAVRHQGEIYNNVNIKIMNKYAYKVTGEYSQRSIEDLKAVERYISPPDFIAQAAAQLNIIYSQEIVSEMLFSSSNRAKPVISTIPMDKMMEMSGWGGEGEHGGMAPEFKYKPIWTISANIDTPCDLYQTIYYPDKLETYFHYRASITGNKLTIECTNEPNSEKDVGWIMDDFGMREVQISNYSIKKQKYGKILPIDERLRKEFMLWLTKEHNIYSLGRFATWRQILLDDVVKDVNVIENLIQGSGYENNKHAWRVA